LLFFSQQKKMLAQLIAQVRQTHVDRGLKHATMGFAQRVVHQLLGEDSRPSLVQIAAGVRVAQRSQECQLGKRPIE
jgi:hypothetical protein